MVQKDLQNHKGLPSQKVLGKGVDAGVELAVELTGQRDTDALLATFGRRVEQLFPVSRCWLLPLEASGRSLVWKDYSFEVDDFSHPFSHVIKEGKARSLSHSSVCRLDHPQFSELLEAAQPFHQCILEPIYNDRAQLLGLLMIAGSDTHWPEAAESPLFRRLLNLLAGQWQRLKLYSADASQRLLLQRSLSELRDDETQRRNAQRLSTTLLGPSACMADLRMQIVRAAGSQLSVLIQGETGCGKDLVARAVHQFSSRSGGPLVVVNCAAIPDSLLESELFGYHKGAFSGASEAKTGLLAQADGGTLFLDEIGDMPLGLQSKLLRVLETRMFRPLGAAKEQHSDFRLVAATHQPLRSIIRDGGFRQDLFYRLNQFPLQVAPLRERPDDVEPLARAFIEQFREREAMGPLGISTAALHRLRDYRFPGNVRELRNLIEFACLQTPPQADIRAEDLRLDLLACASTDKAVQPGNTTGSESSTSDDGEAIVAPGLPDLADIRDLRAATRAFEAAIIGDRLRRFNGSRSLAAESLGVPKRTLAHKCLKFRELEEGGAL